MQQPQDVPKSRRSFPAVLQLSHNLALALLVVGSLAAIALYNFFGVAITKSLSATHRMVLDSLRTLGVWGFALGVYYDSPGSGRGQRLQLLLTARSGAQSQSFYCEQMCRFIVKRVECGGYLVLWVCFCRDMWGQ